MNNVITALGNPEKSKLLNDKNIIIKIPDIQYREGIIEYLEKNKNIQYIIIQEEIPGNISIKELINNIYKINNEIKIILIKNNKSDINNENIINKKDLKNNYIINTFDEKIIKNIINNKKIKIQQNNINKIISEENKFLNKKHIPKNQIITENRKGKVISILGTNGIGKSVFSMIISKQIKNKKIAIVDFDILNNSLHTLLGVENYSQKIKRNIKIINQNNYNESNNKIFEKIIPNQNKTFELKKFIINTNYNIDLISGLNLIFKINEKIIPDKIRMIFKELKKEYDIIIVDTSSECFFDYTREIIRISDEAIFISGANLLEIKKSQRLLSIYNNEWKIEKEKIKILINRCSKNSTDFREIIKAFSEYKIIGKIKLSNYYDYLINNDKTNLEEIKKEISAVKKLIEKERKNIIKNY